MLVCLIHDSFLVSCFVYRLIAVPISPGLQCPPCKAIKPVYQELSNKVDGVAFGQVDVDENGDAAAEFQISVVPTFIFSQGDTTKEKMAGADPSQLNKHISDLAGV